MYCGFEEPTFGFAEVLVVEISQIGCEVVDRLPGLVVYQDELLPDLTEVLELGVTVFPLQTCQFSFTCSSSRLSSTISETVLSSRLSS